MNKKAIAILGVIFLLIVGTLGFLIYSKYSAGPQKQAGNNPTPSATPTPNPDPTANPTPTPGPDPTVAPSSTPSASATVVKLTDDQVVSPVLFFNGLGVTYF